MSFGDLCLSLICRMQSLQPLRHRGAFFAIERAVNKGNSTKLFAEKLRVTSIISDNMLKSDSKSLFSGTPILYAEGQFVACHFSPSNYVPFRKIGKKHLEEELRRAMCTEDSRTDALFEVGKNSLIKMKKKKTEEKLDQYQKLFIPVFNTF